MPSGAVTWFVKMTVAQHPDVLEICWHAHPSYI